jgi:hypothetical protein
MASWYGVARRRHGRPRTHWRHGSDITASGRVLLLVLAIGSVGVSVGRAEGTLFGSPDRLAATSSDEARREAIQAIPFERIDQDARGRVASVLRDTTLYRRMPIRVIDCDPDLYLFLLRHPDVVVNIWRVLGISQLDLGQAESGDYRLAEPSGTRGQMEFLYQSPDKHVAFVEGNYRGPILGRPIAGRCVLLLRSGYVREPNDRHYITTRLDAFMQIDDVPTEIIAKTAYPLMMKTAEHNFEQTLAFVGSLSRTAEVNHRGVQRLAGQLKAVDPTLRARLAELAVDVAKNAPRNARANQPVKLGNLDVFQAPALVLDPGAARRPAAASRVIDPKIILTGCQQ